MWFHHPASIAFTLSLLAVPLLVFQEPINKTESIRTSQSSVQLLIVLSPLSWSWNQSLFFLLPPYSRGLDKATILEQKYKVMSSKTMDWLRWCWAFWSLPQLRGVSPWSQRCSFTRKRALPSFRLLLDRIVEFRNYCVSIMIMIFFFFAEWSWQKPETLLQLKPNMGNKYINILHKGVNNKGRNRIEKEYINR